jgi:hypothetical protein
VLALGAWLAMRALDPAGRVATLAALAVIGLVALGVYVALARRWLAPAVAGATA